MNFAPGGMKVTTVEKSFSEATASAIPTSMEYMCMESDSVSLLSDKDGDNKIIERFPFTHIRIAIENPTVRQDTSYRIM